MIHTARTYLNVPDQDAHLAKLLGSMPIHRQNPALMPPASDVAHDAEPAVAVVQRGAWVAFCPSPGCPSGEFVEPGLPFFCCVCANAAVGHLWRPVVWPANRGAIEAALGERPVPQTRNWLPGETPESLRAEFAAELLRAAGLVLPTMDGAR